MTYPLSGRAGTARSEAGQEQKGARQGPEAGAGREGIYAGAVRHGGGS